MVEVAPSGCGRPPSIGVDGNLWVVEGRCRSSCSTSLGQRFGGGKPRRWCPGKLVEVSERTLSPALHLATGVVLGVVGRSSCPRPWNASPAWVPLVAFVAGGALFMGLDGVIGSAHG